jgi:SPP1 family predicted phage head-tail adaptor
MTLVGPMRHVVQIQQRVATQEATGEPLAAWEVVGTRRCEVIETPGREVFSAKERSGRIPTVFKLRHPRDDFEILPQMRAVVDGKLYDILSASDPDGLRVDIVLTCEQLIGEPTS